MLYTGLLLGFLSSFHCIGMCGPIALILPVSKKSAFKKHIQILLYHAGRIFTYSLLGLLFGLVGKGFSLAGIQQQMSIIIGVAMVSFVVFPKISHRITYKIKPVTQVFNTIKLKLGLYLKKESFYALFLIGFFNGFLPCGMVYIALLGAVAIPEIPGAMSYMILFGLGTVPLLSALLYASDAFGKGFRAKLQKVIPVLVIFVGVLFILRGLGLGIPYISPMDNSLHLYANPQYCH